MKSPWSTPIHKLPRVMLKVWGDGVHDDTEALQHVVDTGEEIPGVKITGNTIHLSEGVYRVTDTIYTGRNANVNLIMSVSEITFPARPIIHFRPPEDPSEGRVEFSGCHIRGV
jgi:hypothetical protein